MLYLYKCPRYLHTQEILTAKIYEPGDEPICPIDLDKMELVISPSGIRIVDTNGQYHFQPGRQQNHLPKRLGGDW